MERDHASRPKEESPSGDVLFVHRLSGIEITTAHIAEISRGEASGIIANVIDISRLRSNLAMGGRTEPTNVLYPRGNDKPGFDKVTRGYVFVPFTEGQITRRQNELSHLLNKMKQNGYSQVPQAG